MLNSLPSRPHPAFIVLCLVTASCASPVDAPSRCHGSRCGASPFEGEVEPVIAGDPADAPPQGQEPAARGPADGGADTRDAAEQPPVQGDGGEPPAALGARDRLKALLQKLASNEQFLTGQHSMLWDAPWDSWFPTKRDEYVLSVAGNMPALFSSDFGDFAGDDLKHRPRVADMALAYAEAGAIIQLSYHLCQPDQANGCGFDVMHGFSSRSPYPGDKIDEMLRPGSPLYQEHMKRLDEVAGYLKKLRDAGVPVLWRPYHEMNGDWFWWCQQPRYKELWRQMHDRFTNHHKLDNLVWVFSSNYWGTNWGEAPDQYYPGHDVVDVLGVDIYTNYGHAYEQRIHDHLQKLGGGKPLAVTENGPMPDFRSVGDAQPGWTYFSTWWGFERAPYNPNERYDGAYRAPGSLTLSDIDFETGGTPETTPPASPDGYPVCASKSSDPDGDGWGWENEKSCRVTAQSKA